MGRAKQIFLATILSIGYLWSPATSASLLLGHFEFECIDDSGCTHSLGSGTEANYQLTIFPDTLDFGSYTSGETASVTLAVEPFIAAYFSNGLNPAPEPMEFPHRILGAGGFSPVMTKDDFLNGKTQNNAVLNLDGGYDVASVNGIDLALNLPVTHIKFDLFNLQILRSNLIDDGVALRTHFRFEFLNDARVVPVPATFLLLSTGILVLIARYRRAGDPARPRTT